MEIDRRRIRRLIRQRRPKERAFDRAVRAQTWMDRQADIIQKAVRAVGGHLPMAPLAVSFRGPATFDQPPLLVRERGGIVEVKLAHPLH